MTWTTRTTRRTSPKGPRPTSPKTWTMSLFNDGKRNSKTPYLNASRQVECKVQYKPYYANIDDSI